MIFHRLTAMSFNPKVAVISTVIIGLSAFLPRVIKDSVFHHNIFSQDSVIRIEAQTLNQFAIDPVQLEKTCNNPRVKTEIKKHFCNIDKNDNNKNQRKED